MNQTSSCPKTGRSSTACDTPDHRNCPDLRIPKPVGPSKTHTLGREYTYVRKVA